MTTDEVQKTAKTKCEFHGEELLGPQASLRVTPCPPAPSHTRGKVIRPPSQIKNNSYNVIRTRDLDDLLHSLRAHDYLSTIWKLHKLVVLIVGVEVFKYRVGGEGGG